MSEAPGFKPSAKLQHEHFQMDWKCNGPLTSGMTVEAYNAVVPTLCQVSSHHLEVTAGCGSWVQMSACSLICGWFAARASGQHCMLRAPDCSVHGAEAACLAGDGAAAAFRYTALACDPQSFAPDAGTVSGSGSAIIPLLRCVFMHGMTGLRGEDRSRVV